MSARTGIGGGEQLEPRREGQRSLGPRDRHRAVLERLPQRLEARSRELAELVQEEDAAMGEGDLARAAAGSRRRRARPGRSCGAGPGTGARASVRRRRAGPATLAILVTSIASASPSGGRIEGSRRAAIDLPAPGGPMTSAPWPPAAAISSPRRSPRWPFRSDEVGRAPRRAACAGTAGSPGGKLAGGQQRQVRERRGPPRPRCRPTSLRLAGVRRRDGDPRAALALAPARPSRARPGSGRIDAVERELPGEPPVLERPRPEADRRR